MKKLRIGERHGDAFAKGFKKCSSVSKIYKRQLVSCIKKGKRMNIQQKAGYSVTVSVQDAFHSG